MKTPLDLRDAVFAKRCVARYADEQRAGRVPNLYRIVLEELAKPAPSYFVDYYHATSRLRKALTAGAVPGQTAGNNPPYACSAMWTDMLRDLQLLMKKHPTTPFRDLVLRLCAGTAGSPRFYLSPRRAMAIVRPHLKLV